MKITKLKKSDRKWGIFLRFNILKKGKKEEIIKEVDVIVQEFIKKIKRKFIMDKYSACLKYCYKNKKIIYLYMFIKSPFIPLRVLNKLWCDLIGSKEETKGNISIIIAENKEHKQKILEFIWEHQIRNWSCLKYKSKYGPGSKFQYGEGGRGKVEEIRPFRRGLDEDLGIANEIRTLIEEGFEIEEKRRVIDEIKRLLEIVGLDEEEKMRKVLFEARKLLDLKEEERRIRRLLKVSENRDEMFPSINENDEGGIVSEIRMLRTGYDEAEFFDDDEEEYFDNK